MHYNNLHWKSRQQEQPLVTRATKQYLICYSIQKPPRLMVASQQNEATAMNGYPLTTVSETTHTHLNTNESYPASNY